MHECGVWALMLVVVLVSLTVVSWQDCFAGDLAPGHFITQSESAPATLWSEDPLVMVTMLPDTLRVTDTTMARLADLERLTKDQERRIDELTATVGQLFETLKAQARFNEGAIRALKR